MNHLIPIERDPTRRQRTVFGLAWLVFFSILAWLAWQTGGWPTAAIGLGTLAVAVPAVGWAVPGVMRRAYVGMAYLTWPIGLVVSCVVLGVIYYLVLTPIGLVLKWLGHDAMDRRFDRETETYWQPKDPPGDAGRYFRQF